MPHQHRHLHDRRDLVGRVGGMDSMGLSGSGGRGADVQANEDMSTVVRTVYKTLAPTFTGLVAGYSTMTPDDGSLPSDAPGLAPPSPTQKPPQSRPTVQNRPTMPQDASSMSPGFRRPPLAKSWQTVLGEAIQPPSLAQTAGLGNNQFQTTRAAASLPGSTAELSASMGTNGGSGNLAGTSTGAKVGIAFGVFSGVLAVGLLVVFLFSRHRRQAGDRQKLQDGSEKLHGAPAPAASPYEPTSRRSDPRAPRISLRPVTQFFPNWSGFDRRASRGAAMSLAPSSAAGGSPWDRPSTSQSSYAANPFVSQAERLPSPIAEERSARSSPSASLASFRDKMRAPGSASAQDPLAANGPVLAAAAAAGGAAGAASSLSRKTSMRKDGPKNADLTLPKHFGVTPPSPAETEYSMTSVAPGSALPASNGAAAIAAAGGPQNSGVHRVQLDFKPTLDDEMELRAGQLVRLLHEYDDGWALVIRVDRSQQGVVPRTCLSTRPVKPRLQRPGPPVSPTGQARGPNHANGQRPMTPQGMRGPGLPESPKVAPSPRPASPASHVSLPESPMSRSPRAQSPSSTGRQASPAGPSPIKPTQSLRQGPPPGPPAASPPVGRKPVPGQASAQPPSS